MPATITPAPPRPHSQEPSHGGVPPKGRSPFGGGGGGGGEGNSGSGGGPRQILHRFRGYVAIAIFIDQLLFLLLSILFFARKGVTHLNPATLRQVSDWTPVALPSILWLSTFALLLSCATMEQARRRIFREIDVLEEWLGLGQPALTASRRWIALTAGLGTIALTGLLGAWQQLMAHGIGFQQPSSPAARFLYLFTGIHGLHQALGLGALGFCLTGLGYLRKVEARQIGIDATAWLWYAICGSWLCLLTLLRFGQ